MQPKQVCDKLKSLLKTNLSGQTFLHYVTFWISDLSWGTLQQNWDAHLCEGKTKHGVFVLCSKARRKKTQPKWVVGLIRPSRSYEFLLSFFSWSSLWFLWQRFFIPAIIPKKNLLNGLSVLVVGAFQDGCALFFAPEQSGCMQGYKLTMIISIAMCLTLNVMNSELTFTFPSSKK